MNVKELIAELQDAPEDAEVRIADIGFRSHMQHKVDEVVTVEVSDTGYGAQDDDYETFVYLSMGDQPHDRPYLPTEARDEFGV